MQPNTASTLTQKIVLINQHIVILYTSLLVRGFLKVILIRINEHAFKDKNSVIYNHINNSYQVNYLVGLDQIQTERDKFDKNIYSVAAVKDNINIIDSSGHETFFYLKNTSYKTEKSIT